MWRHHGHQQSRRRFAEPQGHRLAKSRAYEFFLEKMPHLVEHQDHLRACDFGSWRFASFVADPIENRNITDAEQTGDGAKTHVAHGVEQQRQGLHGGRFAARRRHGEVAAATAAVVALMATDDPVLFEVPRATALAADGGHSPSPR
jgi:hypothetical protein